MDNVQDFMASAVVNGREFPASYLESIPKPEGIGRPHPDRAAQFKPFAALKGYYELLEEKEPRE